MKKLSRLLLLIIVLASVMIPVGCTISYEKSESGLIFRRNGISDTCSVVGYKGTDEDVVVPSSYNGMKVTTIAMGAFTEPLETSRINRFDYEAYHNAAVGLISDADAVYDRYYYNRVKSVVLPDTVTTISDFAFQNCGALTSITMTNNVSFIGRAAFTGCNYLTEIQLSDDANECNKLPSKLKNISDGTFFQCASLEKITLSSVIKKIGKYAFSQCAGLKDIYLGEANTIEDNDKLASQTAITDDADVSLTEIGDYAFKEATSIRFIKLPSSVNKMGVSVFESATALVSATLSDHITSLSKATFKNCSSLDETMLDLANVEVLGESIFEGCTTLENLDQVLNDRISVIPERAFFGCTGLIDVDLTQFDLITKVSDSAFRNCSSIKKFVFRDDTNYIGAHSLRGCSLLRSVLIPEGTEVVGNSAFADCDSLVLYKATQQNNNQVKWVGWKNGLDDSQIIDGVTKSNLIGDNAAEYVVSGTQAKLTRFLDDTISTYTIPAKVNGADATEYDVYMVNGYAFKNCNGLTKIIVPSTISEIGASAFAYATSLVTVGLPSSITTFGASMFANCVSLTTINFDGDNSVTDLGNYVFDGCSVLDNVEFKKATSVGEFAFRNCSSLTTIKLGQVKKVSKYAFENCVSLTDVITVDASNNELNSIEEIDAYAFSGCSSLADTSIPSSAKKIGECAFKNCENFVTVHIPASVTSIGNQAFKGCKKIEEFVVDGESSNFTAVGGSLYELKAVKNGKYTIVTPDGKILKQSGSSYVLVDKSNNGAYFTNGNAFDIYYRDILRFVPVANTTNTRITVTATEKDVKVSDILAAARAQALALGYTGDVNALGVSYSKDKTAVIYPTSEASLNNVVVSYTDCISAIGSFAFEDTAVETVTLPASVKIQEGAFNGCTKLESITITPPAAALSKAFGDVDGALYEGKWEIVDGTPKFTATKLYQYPSNNGTLIETLTLPDTVTEIMKGALMDCNIGTLVLDRALTKISNDAFKNAKIGAFVLDSAVLFNGNLNPQGGGIIGTLEAVDSDTEAESGYTKLNNANKNFAIDEYGILYSISPDRQNYNVDVEGSGIKRTTILYVPETVSVPGNVLHLDNYAALTINAYAFSANTDIETIFVKKNSITLLASAFEGHTAPINVIYKGSEDDYIFESRYTKAGNEAFIASAEEGAGYLGKVYVLSQTAPVDATGRVGFWYYVSGKTATGDDRYYEEYGDIAKNIKDNKIIYREGELDGAKFDFEVKLATKLDEDDNVERYYIDDETRDPAIFLDNNGNEVYVISFWNYCADCDEYSQAEECPTCGAAFTETYPTL